MTKFEETNLLLHSINESLKKGEVSDYDQVMSAAQLDIAKSLSIIADGIATLNEQMEKQNEQMEKIESDLSKLEHSYSSKWYQMPRGH